jgi:hypothetical protein
VIEEARIGTDRHSMQGKHNPDVSQGAGYRETDPRHDSRSRKNGSEAEKSGVTQAMQDYLTSFIGRKGGTVP